MLTDRVCQQDLPRDDSALALAVIDAMRHGQRVQGVSVAVCIIRTEHQMLCFIGIIV